MNLALFDFDGTITSEDTYTKFIFFSTPKLRFVMGLAIIWPVVVLYKLGVLPASKTRPILSKVAFCGRRVDVVSEQAQRFVLDYISNVIRPIALDKIAWHKAQGDEIFVVSASLSPYIKIWCHNQGIKFVCSELASDAGKYTGSYTNGDCSGERKVRFICDIVDLSKYSAIYAYGDSDEDLPMLEIADVKYFRWQKVQD